jgi:hypothetical protein
MKKILVILLLCILAAAFMAACNNHVSPNPVTNASSQFTPTPICIPGNAAYTQINYASLEMGTKGQILYRTEAEYLQNYSGWAPEGSPTPEPVPVDFSKKMVIGIRVAFGCQIPEWELTGMTNDCGSLIIDQKFTYTYCGGPMCYEIGAMDKYYTVDRTDLPVVARNTSVGCDKSLTVVSGPFISTATAIAWPGGVTITPGSPVCAAPILDWGELECTILDLTGASNTPQYSNVSIDNIITYTHDTRDPGCYSPLAVGDTVKMYYQWGADPVTVGPAGDPTTFTLTGVSVGDRIRVNASGCPTTCGCGNGWTMYQYTKIP